MVFKLSEIKPAHLMALWYYCNNFAFVKSKKEFTPPPHTHTHTQNRVMISYQRLLGEVCKGFVLMMVWKWSTHRIFFFSVRSGHSSWLKKKEVLVVFVSLISCKLGLFSAFYVAQTEAFHGSHGGTLKLRAYGLAHDICDELARFC